MNGENKTREETREALIESLLQAAYGEAQGASSERVDAVMAQIRHNASSSALAVVEKAGGWFRTGSRRVSWGIAAALLIAMFFGLQYFGPPQKALAAIERSLVAAAEQVARKYLIAVTCIDGETSQEIHNELYVQGNDRFALRHPALLPGADIWLGKNGDQTWVVPSIGPVRTGNDLALSRWLDSREQLSTPYLHVTTVLNRMSRDYRLQESGEATIRLAGGKEVVCRHILGELKAGVNPKFPSRIELWSDAHSGVAMRIEARWRLPESASGREKVVLEFAGEPELPDNWFDAEGHYTGNRRKITLDEKETE